MKKFWSFIGVLLFLMMPVSQTCIAAMNADLEKMLLKITASVLEEKPTINGKEMSLPDTSYLSDKRKPLSTTPGSLLRLYFPLNHNDAKSYSGTVYGQTYQANYTYNSTFFNGRACYLENDSIDGSKAYYGYSGNAVVMYGASVENEVFSLDTPIPILNETILNTGGSLRSSSTLTIMGYLVTLDLEVTVQLTGSETISLGSVSDCRTVYMNFSYSMAGESETEDFQDVWILAPNIGKLRIALLDQFFNRHGWMSLTGGTVGGKSIGDILNPPIADFTAAPTHGVSPLFVQFSDQSSGTVTQWSWNFGDGATSSDQNPSHTYQVPGNYTVSLTVSRTGASDTETKQNHIMVTEPPPEADFSASQTNGLPLNPITFYDHSKGNITEWAWDFGDGSTSSDQNPIHTYQNQGRYPVSLTVSGSSGMDTKTKADYILMASPAVDINKDKKVDINDLILVLNLLAGEKTDPEPSQISDINGDMKTGIEEAIYIIEVLSHPK